MSAPAAKKSVDAHGSRSAVVRAQANVAQPSPGPSNTRALTPRPDNKADPIVLQVCVDWLKLAYRLALHELELALLAAALGADSEGPCSYEIAREVFELRALNGSATGFRLSNATKTVTVGEDPSGFPVQVEFRALYLRTEQLERLVQEGEELARHFAAGDIPEVRVWRCDLCVDIAGVSFVREDEDRCVTRARTQVRFQAPERVYTRKQGHQSRVTGFSIGKRETLAVRIYDKTEELHMVHGADSEKTRTEVAAYRAAGWDGSSRVWRVEVEMRGEFLRKFGAGTPSALLAKLDSLWHYIVGREGERTCWLRFVVPGTASRIERCATDPRWILVQRASFSGREVAQKVDGDRGGLSAPQLLGDVLSFLGARSSLQPHDAESSAQDMVRADFARAADLVVLVPHLMDAYPRRRAAARARNWARPKAEEDP